MPSKPDITTPGRAPDSAPGADASSTPTIPDHELLRRIGQGAYGEVWLARNILGTYRAVKVVRRSSFREERAYEREFRGIQSYEPISRTSDGLLDIFQAGRNDEAGYYYYVMELADGAEAVVNGGNGDVEQKGISPSTFNTLSVMDYQPRTLQSDLQQCGRLSTVECVSLGLNLTLALGQLHRRGLIHRDIKPANIIFVDGTPKLADIGLVTNFDDTCSFVGTDGFVAPEGPTSPRADLFSLGKVLYEASTGKDRKEFPEPATGLGEANNAHELAELNAVILKACATEPFQRYGSAQEFHADLALVNSGRSVLRRRRLEVRVAMLTRMALAVGIIALLGFGGYAFQRHQTKEARRLLKENVRLTESEVRERHRAENALLSLRLSRAQDFLNQNKDAAALAQWAQLLRQHPTNRFIAEQILSTLSQRNFALPIARLSHSNMTHTSFTSDGKRILTSFAGGVTQIREARTGNAIAPPVDHGAEVRWTEFSPDGKWLATASRREVRLLSARSGEIQSTIPITYDVDRMVFSPDSQGLMIVSGAKAAIHEIHHPNRVVGPLNHGGRILHAAFSRNGGRILTYSKELGTAVVWDAGSGRAVGKPFEHTPMQYFPVRPKLSADGKRILTVHTVNSDSHPDSEPAVFDDGTAARLWNVDSGEATSRVIDLKSGIRCTEFSADGTRIYIACNSRLGWIYDGQTGEELMGPLANEGAVSAAAFSHDGRQLATGYGDTFVTLWDTGSGSMLGHPLMQGFETTSVTSIKTLEFSPTGGQLLVRSLGATWLWDIRPGAAQSRVLKHDEPVTYAEFGPDGRRIITAMDEQVTSGVRGRSARGHSAQLWDAGSGQSVGAPLRHERGVIAAAFSPDAQRVVTASRDRTARLWNAATGEAISPPMVHPRAVRSASFSRDGKHLWTGCGQHSAWLWDGERGELLGNLLNNEGEPLEYLGISGRSDDLSRDQEWILTCARILHGDALATGVQVWNARTGEPRFAGAIRNTMRSARFSPDGERFVSTADPGGAFLWNARTGELLAGPIQYEGRAVYFAQFSPDGTRLVTAGDRAACVWEVKNGKLVGQPMLHLGEVVYAEFSPDGRYVITASWEDRAAFIWDADTGFQLGSALQHDDWVTHAAFSPDGKWVVTTSADKTARIWEVTDGSGAIPAWVADLAETIAGHRIDPSGVRRSVGLDQLLTLRQNLAENGGVDSYSQWARWFFADRDARSHSSKTQSSPSPRSAQLSGNATAGRSRITETR